MMIQLLGEHGFNYFFVAYEFFIAPLLNYLLHYDMASKN